MRLCEFPGCGRKHDARGLCKSHHKQLSRGRELTAIGQSFSGWENVASLVRDEGRCGSSCWFYLLLVKSGDEVHLTYGITSSMESRMVDYRSRGLEVCALRLVTGTRLAMMAAEECLGRARNGEGYFYKPEHGASGTRAESMALVPDAVELWEWAAGRGKFLDEHAELWEEYRLDRLQEQT